MLLLLVTGVVPREAMVSSALADTRRNRNTVELIIKDNLTEQLMRL
jgi:hypothetical protein